MAMMKLIYTAVLSQTDNDGNPDGLTFTFKGSQTTAASPPQTSDLQSLATAMGSDISTQMVAQYPVQSTDDGSNDATGGQG